MTSRQVEVSPERLLGWVERYSATHPGVAVTATGGGLRLDADGGASALMLPLLPFAPGQLGSGELLPALAAHALRPTVTALLLIRRGGYAVGVAQGGKLLRSKVGSRYVQARTAAGGWSQQRFARRREGQAKELLRATAGAWAGLVATPAPVVLVTGGDHALCEHLLLEPPLRGLAVLGSSRHLEVPDPRLTVLRDAAIRVQALLVTVREP